MPRIKLLPDNIYQMISGLSPSAKAHAERCKTLTEYILSCPGSREVFDKQLYNSNLVMAISYHDFAKALIAPNSVNARYCRTAPETEAYRQHTLKAEEYIIQHSDRYNDEGSGFDKYLFECSTMHHEHFDGSGFPKGLSGEDIPMSARLCAVVDYIDRALDFDFSDGVYIKRIEKMLTKVSGKKLDPRICELVLKRTDILEKLANDMHEEFKNTPEAISRLELSFVGQYSAVNFSVVGCEMIAVMRDADFGEVRAELFRAVAAQGESAIKLDNLLRMKALNQAEVFIKDGMSFGRITVFESARTLSSDSYIDILETQLEQYGVPPGMITVCVAEDILLSGSHKIYENLKYLRKMGVRLSVDGFGELCKSFDAFEDFEFDEIRLSKHLINQAVDTRESFEVMMGLVTVARNLGIDVVCTEVNSPEDERLFIGMGVNILSGMLYGGALDRETAERLFERKTGVADEED